MGMDTVATDGRPVPRGADTPHRTTCMCACLFSQIRPTVSNQRSKNKKKTVMAPHGIVVTILRRYVRQHIGFMLLSALCVALSPTQEILIPQLYGGVIVSLGRPGVAGLPRASAAVIGILLLVHGCLLLRDYLNDRIHASVQTFVKVELLETLFNKHSERYAPLTTGDIVYILNVIPDIAGMWFRYFRDYIVPCAVTFVVAFLVLMRFDRLMGLGFAALVGVLMLVVCHAPRHCLPEAEAHAQDMGRLHDRLEELVANMAAVYTSNRHGEEIGKLRREAEPDFFAAFRRTGWCARRYKALLVPLVVVLLGVAIWRLGTLARRHHMPPDRCVATFVLLTSLLSSLLWIVDLVERDIVDVGQLAACDRIFGGETTPPMPRVPPAGESPPPSDRYACGLVNVTFVHATGAGAGGVRGLTVHFERGERTALLGPVGAGKTTVLHLLLGLHAPEPGGDAYYAGRWYADQPLATVRQAIGYVPQQPTLFNRSVLDNVMYGNEGRVTPAAAAALIVETGLAGRLVDGVHTAAGKGGQRLSGGQRQLVWCLRVLLQDPDVLVMDEPTASMDTKTRAMLLALLDRLMRNRTVIIVSHDPELVAATTRSVILES